MAVSGVPKGNHAGTITLIDGDSPTNQLALDYDMGDLQFGELADELNETTAIQRRGKPLCLNLCILLLLLLMECNHPGISRQTVSIPSHVG